MNQIAPIQSADRLILSVAATSDSQGRIVAGPTAFNLGPAEQGYVYEGTVQVPDAPAGAQINATILGKAWGQWAGPTNFGPIQMYGGETLQVTGTGFTPSTQYVLIMTGVSLFPDAAVMPVPPNAPMSVVSVETATLLVNGVVPAGAPNKITSIRPPTLTRRVTIVGQGFGVDTIYTLTGDVTGAVYGLFTPGANVPQFAAVEPAIDPTYTLTYFSGSGASGTIWLLASFTNPLVESNNASPLRVNNAFGTFSQSFGPTVSYNTSNQLVIAAQGGLIAIYLQEISVSVTAANGPVRFTFHDSSPGTNFANIIVPSTGSEQITFPGGYRMASNTGLQVDTALATSGGTLRVSGTFAVGPAVS